VGTSEHRESETLLTEFGKSGKEIERKVGIMYLGLQKPLTQDKGN